MTKLTPHNCSQCGSKLILISTFTEKIAGNLFPQTTSTFRCTDSECQDRQDHEMEKRLQARKEKEITDKRRFEERIQKKHQDLQLKNHL